MNIVFKITYIKYLFIFTGVTTFAQQDPRMYRIIEHISASNIYSDIKTLADFGTRHTLSDTLSDIRGIGAARRWIKNSFEETSRSCNNCLEVFEQKNYFEADGRRLTRDVWINNIVAIQRGTTHPNRYVIMSGDIDSRVSDPNDFMSDSPGANDNASGWQAF